MSMLVAVTEAAVALAEMQTQPGPIQKAAGHIAMKMAVATSEDGGRALCPQPFDDCENTVFEGGTPGCASDEPMEVDLV